MCPGGLDGVRPFVLPPTAASEKAHPTSYQNHYYHYYHNYYYSLLLLLWVLLFVLSLFILLCPLRPVGPTLWRGPGPRIAIPLARTSLRLLLRGRHSSAAGLCGHSRQGQYDHLGSCKKSSPQASLARTGSAAQAESAARRLIRSLRAVVISRSRV